MIVVDVSALVNALLDDGIAGEDCRAELGRDDHWVAPAHLEVEVFSAIRGRLLGATVTEERAADAVQALHEAVVDTVGTAPLLARMWELRDNLSGYDAAYVAVAELLACPLVTCDERLVRAPALRCEVRLPSSW